MGSLVSDEPQPPAPEDISEPVAEAEPEVDIISDEIPDVTEDEAFAGIDETEDEDLSILETVEEAPEASMIDDEAPEAELLAQEEDPSVLDDASDAYSDLEEDAEELDPFAGLSEEPTDSRAAGRREQ